MESSSTSHGERKESATRSLDTVELIDQPEFAMYAVLKIEMYLQSSRQQSEKPDRSRDGVALPPISARRLNRLFVQSPSTHERNKRNYTDFFDVSSCFLRERLKNLNHGTALEQVGRGVRNAMLYRWNEPIDSSTMRSFRRLRSVLGEEIHLAIDLYRLDIWFGEEPFSTADAVEVFRRNRESCLRRRWHTLSTDTNPGSATFTKFLQARLDELVRNGAATKSSGWFRLTRKGLEAVHWFDLFVHSVVYPTDGVAGSG